jgi:hypothetical protein
VPEWKALTLSDCTALRHAANLVEAGRADLTMPICRPPPVGEVGDHAKNAINFNKFVTCRPGAEISNESWTVSARCRVYGGRRDEVSTPILKFGH